MGLLQKCQTTQTPVATTTITLRRITQAHDSLHYMVGSHLFIRLISGNELTILSLQCFVQSKTAVTIIWINYFAYFNI